ncbi:MAG TPA: helix-turn-helix domain-containing protein [Candidatus Acidoferrales bacterium]|nr:helix-turn-helix domain-containing protein [Candidatus Acidoferrales bacterium]
MHIGDRLRALREEKKLSQGDIEKRTGLFRCYVSRVENGHTIPALDTIEKFARALEVPLYQLFYEGEEPPESPPPPKRRLRGEILHGSARKEARILRQLQRLLGRIEDRDKSFLLFMAEEMARQKKTPPAG